MDQQKQEIVDTLQEAEHEIIGLRRRNEILGAKVEVMDLFACVLFTQAASHVQGQAVDIAWKLRQLSDKIQGNPPYPKTNES